MIPRAFWHYIAALYFAFQSLIATFWWLILLVEPRARPLFRPAGTPDSALFSFLLPDLVFFIGAGLWSAVRLVKNPQTARVPLAIHLSATAYATLFCLSQTLLTGEATLATVLMFASLLCGGFLARKAVFSGG